MLISPEPALLAGSQAIDLLAFQLYTASCLARQNPTLANGACFAFRRELFERAGGYAGMDHLPSGDDVLLLHKFAQLPGLHYSWHAGTPVYTKAVASWQGLWQQRLRWAGKAGAYVSSSLQFGQALAFLTALSIIAGLVLSLFERSFLAPVLIAWTIKINIDHLLLKDISAYYRQQIPAWQYWFTHLFHPFYLVAIGTTALLGVKTKWKGRE